MYRQGRRSNRGENAKLSIFNPKDTYAVVFFDPADGTNCFGGKISTFGAGRPGGLPRG